MLLSLQPLDNIKEHFKEHFQPEEPLHSKERSALPEEFND
jgi:hypothetical protein